jgi:hypothetical protein
MTEPYYDSYGGGPHYNDSGTGPYADGSGVGLGGTGQTMDGNGYGYGIGLGGPEAQYGPGDANSASLAPAYGSGYGQHQLPMYPQGHYGQPPVQQYPWQSFSYPSATPGYGSQPGWQPGQQNRGNDWSKGSGGFVQGGPAVETGQEWRGRRRVEIFDQEDLPPVMNVQQIPQPSGLSKKTKKTKKSRSSGNRQDSRQNRGPEDEIVRYGMGLGGSRAETFSQEERTNV